MKFLNKIRSRVPLIDLALLVAVTAVKFVYFVFCTSICKTVDSAEYIRINVSQLITQGPDRYRLPVYPMLIDICEKLFGDRYLDALCWCQFLASVLSLVLIYFTIRKLTDKRYIYLPLTAVYGLASAVIGWDKTILTESFSLSLTVCMLFGLVYYIKEDKLRYLAVAAAGVTVGAFLRAVFVIYAGCILAFLVLRMIFTGEESSEGKKHRRITDLKGLSFCAVPVILILCYAVMFNSCYGGFTISDSSLGQQLFIVLDRGYYEDSTDEELKKTAQELLSCKRPEAFRNNIKEILDAVCDGEYTEEQLDEVHNYIIGIIPEDKLPSEEFTVQMKEYLKELYGNEDSFNYIDKVTLVRYHIMNNFERDRIEEFVSEAKRANLKNYLFYLYRNSTESFEDCYEQTNGGKIQGLVLFFTKNVVPYLTPTLAQGILMGFGELCLYLVILIRKRRSDWIHLGFGILIVMTGLLSVFGTNAEYMRTALTMYPMLYMVLGIWLSALADRIRKGKIK